MANKDTIKLTPAMQKRLCKAIRDGMPYDVACDLAGICRTTFYNYRKEAEEIKQAVASGAMRKPKSERRIRLLNILNSIKRAEAKGIETLLAKIRKAGDEPRHWMAIAWLLERRYPEMFGKRLGVKLEGGPSQMTLDKMIEVVMHLTEKYPKLRRELAEAFDEIAKAEEESEGGE